MKEIKKMSKEEQELMEQFNAEELEERLELTEASLWGFSGTRTSDWGATQNWWNW